MTDNEILEIYMYISQNVRALSSAKDGLIKDINYKVRKKDKFQVSIKTKMLALVYSAWSESQFLQIAHTPNAFRYTEIEKIKAKKDSAGIGEGWAYMLAMALTKVGDVTKSSDLQGRLAKLRGLVSDYIKDPSIIRNKLAHGQWIVALNRENTKRNESLSSEIECLDPVVIHKQFDVHMYLGYIVRDLVQSPRAGFHRHYWTNIVNLESFLKRTSGWNIHTKERRLLVKPIKMKKAESR